MPCSYLLSWQKIQLLFWESFPQPILRTKTASRFISAPELRKSSLVWGPHWSCLSPCILWAQTHSDSTVRAKNSGWEHQPCLRFLHTPKELWKESPLLRIPPGCWPLLNLPVILRPPTFPIRLSFSSGLCGTVSFMSSLVCLYSCKLITFEINSLMGGSGNLISSILIQ